MKILFVCLGNICRSPAAEAVMNKLVRDRGLEGTIVCDSAGTSAYHVGEGADPRMARALMERGYRAESLSRPVDRKRDFREFDYLIAMDRQNYRDLNSLAADERSRKKIHMITDFARQRKEKEVPDPYYGGLDGFNHVIDILEDGCSGLLDHVMSHNKD
ncbi:MAG: low molecular weight phosphotyrosine protein phosphatase [Oligoflexales bacterium]|nr:low molecular weight phosphotyrosine protein phosphatase [Oligoflexales bacterium]